MINRWNKRSTRKERSQWLSNLGEKPCNSVKVGILFRWIIHIVARKLDMFMKSIQVKLDSKETLCLHRCVLNVLKYLGIHEESKHFKLQVAFKAQINTGKSCQTSQPVTIPKQERHYINIQKQTISCHNNIQVISYISQKNM